jgi:hypothetical protein
MDTKSTPEANYYPISLESNTSTSSSTSTNTVYKTVEISTTIQSNTPAVPISTINVVPSSNGSTVNGGSMQSPNFIKDEAGWQLKSDGIINANGVNVNGVITAPTLNIGGITEITVESGDALQTTLDSIYAKGGGILRLSPGTYIQTTPLVVYSSTRIQGQSSSNTTINFAGTSGNITLTGTNVYTTGTISSISGGVNVVGSGTTWVSGMIGRQIFISNRWYIITNVVDNTHLTLLTGYSDGLTYSGNYRIADVVKNVEFYGISLVGSTGTAIVASDIRDVNFNDVVCTSNNKGLSLTNFMNIVSDKVIISANTSNGYELTNGSFGNFYSFASVSNTGSGAILNNVKTCGWILSACDSNGSDGINMTSVSSCLLGLELSGNVGQGMEMVSDCNNNFVNNALINSNGSDGIKLTATSDYNTFGASVNITGNGGYGINIASSDCDYNTILSPLFLSNSSGDYLNSGTNTNVISRTVITKGNFGGDGSDGALNISSGTTTIDLGGAEVFNKNYSSISITGTGKLAFSNPHSNGTIITLKSQGNVTITSTTNPAIDASSLGANSGSGGSASGSGGANGAIGQGSYGNIKDANPGNYGNGGTIGSSTGGALATAIRLNSEIIAKILQVTPGGGGGGGGSGYDSDASSQAGAGGRGGRGGGVLIIECAGTYNFGASSYISVSGGNGTNGDNASNISKGCGGGGGGGGGGVCVVLYNSLTANSGTYVKNGGNGGNGGSNNVGGSGTNGGGAGGSGGGHIYNSGYGGNGGAAGNNGTAGGGGGGTGYGGSGGARGTSGGSSGGGGGGGGGGSEGLAFSLLNNYFA